MFNLEIDLKDFLYYLEFGDKRTANSIRSIKSDLRQFLNFISEIEKAESLQDINHHTIRRFLGKELEKKLTKRSLNRKLSTLKLFFKYLVQNEKIISNPVNLVEFSNFYVEEPEFIKKSEITSLRETISTDNTNGLRDRLMLELLYSTGITSQELLSLGEGVFNLDDRELQITNNKELRTVFFSERAGRYFKEYIKSKKEKYQEKYNSDILFVNGSGTRLSDRSLRRIVEKYAKKAQIKREITPYMFRHTFIIHMIIKGMELEHIKRLIGYSTIEILKKYKEMSKRAEIKAYILEKE